MQQQMVATTTGSGGEMTGGRGDMIPGGGKRDLGSTIPSGATIHVHNHNYEPGCTVNQMSDPQQQQQTRQPCKVAREQPPLQLFGTAPLPPLFGAGTGASSSGTFVHQSPSVQQQHQQHSALQQQQQQVQQHAQQAAQQAAAACGAMFQQQQRH